MGVGFGGILRDGEGFWGDLDVVGGGPGGNLVGEGGV